MTTNLSRNAPLFSVILPAYNRADLIGSTIESIQIQEFQSFEIIAVDDGSSDETVDVIRRYPDVRLFTQMNSGPGAARNLGVRNAVGQYIAFLDSDDLWFTWTLQSYANVVKRFENPSFVVGKPFCFESEEQLTRIERSELTTESFRDYLASGDQWRWFGVSSFVVKREVLNQVHGFADGRINGEDADLALRLGTSPGFVQITSPYTFGYRNHSGNVTLDSSKTGMGLDLLLNNEAGNRFPGGSERSAERWRIISRHVRPFATYCARQGDLRPFLRYYLRTLKWHLFSLRWKFLLSSPLIAMFSYCMRNLRLPKFHSKAANAID